MTRKHTLLLAISLCVGAIALGSKAHSQGYSIGYADEFVVALADCSNAACYTRENLWSQSSGADGSRWGFLGAQGANATGRANAREKVMFKYNDQDPNYSGTITVNMTRYWTDYPPYEGAACNSVSQVYYGSASQTLGTNSSNPADMAVNNRMLPVMDFRYDNATPGSMRGYTTTVTISGDWVPTTTTDNCYIINWF